MRKLALWLSLFALSACGSDPSTPPPPPAAPAAPAEADAPIATGVDPAAEARARAAMTTLRVTLKDELFTTMKAQGPTAALDVCAQDARSLTAGVAASSGIAVGRSSLRLRNPSNAGPDWVTAWLTQQGERKADGVGEHVEAATRADGTSVVRVVAPLPVQAPCLMCHGAQEGRAPELAAKITATYPDDQANGYAAGDLRGALWAEAPVVESGLHLELDGTAKWSLDESTRATAAEIDTAVNGPAPADLAAAHATAATVDDALSRMITGCSMEGPSHDQLHHFLEGVFPTVSALKKSTDLAAAQHALWTLDAQMEVFDAHFE